MDERVPDLNLPKGFVLAQSKKGDGVEVRKEGVRGARGRVAFFSWPYVTEQAIRSAVAVAVYNEEWIVL